MVVLSLKKKNGIDKNIQKLESGETTVSLNPQLMQLFRLNSFLKQQRV